MMPQDRSWLSRVQAVTGSLSIAGEPIPLTGGRASAASAIAMAASNVGQLDVDPITWGLTDTLRITLARTATMDVVASGDVATLTGLTGTTTGAASYTAASAAQGVILPRGLRLEGPLWSSDGYRPGNAVAAATGARWSLGGGSLLLDMVYADAYAAEYLVRGRTYDVVHSGRWVGRCRITDVTRERQGRLPDVVTLRLSVQGVA
jgi:hypothetical protein